MLWDGMSLRVVNLGNDMVKCPGQDHAGTDCWDIGGEKEEKQPR